MLFHSTLVSRAKVACFRRPYRVGIYAVHSLGPVNASGKRNQAGDINAERAIAAHAQHAVLPDILPGLFQKLSVHIAALPIDRSQRTEPFIRRHVAGIVVITPVEKTALGTQAAAGARCPGERDLALVPLQDLFDLLYINFLYVC